MTISTANPQYRAIRQEDAEQVHALLRASALHVGNTPPPLAVIEGMLASMSEQLPVVSQAAFSPEGSALMFVLLMPDLSATHAAAQIESAVHPTAQSDQIFDEMYAWIKNTMRTLAEPHEYQGQIQLRASFSDRDQTLFDLFRQWGFNNFTSQHNMVRDLNDEIPSLPLPNAIQLSPYQEIHSEAMRRVFNTGFADHWIGELSAEAWERRFISTSSFRPDQTTLAWHGEKLAGFYLSEHDPDLPQQGWLEIMAVVPSYRRQGLGAALLQHALQSYKKAGCTSAALDVDISNTTNALQLYQRAGFKIAKGSHFFRKSI